MTGPIYNIQNAEIELNKAKSKVLALEEDVKQLAQRSNRFEVEVYQLNERLRLNNEDHDSARKAFGALQDVILGKDSVTETYDDLLAPVQDLVNLKLFIKYHLHIASNEECSVRKLQHELSKVLRSRSTEERDSILSQIREVLGAKDRNADRPHETALQAAKRVMEELGALKEDYRKLNKRKDPEALYELEIAVAEVLGLGDLNTQGKIEYFRTTSANLKQQLHNVNMLGGRTYNPPHGHMVIRTEDFIQMFKDSEDLKLIKEKLRLT